MASHVLKKRKEAIKLMYRHYVLSQTGVATKQDFLDHTKTDWTEKDFDYYFGLLDCLPLIEKRIIEHLDTHWSWERMNNLYKAVLVVANYEIAEKNIDKAIVIDQMIHYIHQHDPEDNYQFINNILDRI